MLGGVFKQLGSSPLISSSQGRVESSWIAWILINWYQRWLPVAQDRKGLSTDRLKVKV